MILVARVRRGLPCSIIAVGASRRSTESCRKKFYARFSHLLQSIIVTAIIAIMAYLLAKWVVQRRPL
jgi:hypothetical protein